MTRRKKQRGSLFAKLSVLCFIAYAAFTLISTQLEVSTLQREIKTLEQNVSRQQVKNDEVERLLSLGDTDEYIEFMAREKLGFCYPDEKILIDRSGS